MKKIATLAFAFAASLSFAAAGPTAKQILDVDSNMLEIEALNSPDDFGITRAYADSCFRSKTTRSNYEIEKAMQKEILKFVIDYQKMPVDGSLVRMRAKIESDKSLRNTIESCESTILACCETIAAGGKPNDSAISKAVKDRKYAISKRAELWSPACRKTCSKQTSGM